MTTADPPQEAVAVGGPLDGTVLGTATAERFQVQMADGSIHLYVRSRQPAAGSQPYDYNGRG